MYIYIYMLLNVSKIPQLFYILIFTNGNFQSAKCQRKSLQIHKVQDAMLSSSFEKNSNYHIPACLVPQKG